MKAKYYNSALYFLKASGTEETQSSVGAVPQMLFQTSENEVNLQDVVVTVEMSSDPGNISSHFCDKLDEDLYLGGQKRTSEGITESRGCALQDINIKHPLTEAKKGIFEYFLFALTFPLVSSIQV